MLAAPGSYSCCRALPSPLRNLAVSPPPPPLLQTPSLLKKYRIDLQVQGILNSSQASACMRCWAGSAACVGMLVLPTQLAHA